MSKQIMIACDFASYDELKHFLDQFQSQHLILKLGMQLIFQLGFSVIQELKQAGHKIFCDLKLHDITNTIKHAIIALSQYQIDWLTIDLAVGKTTLQVAQTLCHRYQIKLLGVTILTNLDESDCQQIFDKQVNLNSLVLNFAKLAAETNLFGIVCAAQEVIFIKQQYPQLMIICPGVQATHYQESDQKRFMTPALLTQIPFDFLVIGRLITKSQNPFHIYQTILTTINQGVKNA